MGDDKQHPYNFRLPQGPYYKVATVDLILAKSDLIFLSFAMLKRLLHQILDFVGLICIGLALVALFLGVSALESDSPPILYAYSLLLGGALILITTPRSWCLSMFARTRNLGMSLCLLTAFFFLMWLIPDALGRSTAMKNATLLKWGGAIVCFLVAALVWDSHRSQSQRTLFSRADWMLAMAFTVIALVLRLMVSPSAAVDEMMIFSGMQYELLNKGQPTLWGFQHDIAHLFSYITFVVTQSLSNLIDPFLLTKIIVSFMGSISVGAFYLLVRIYAARYVAVTAAAILVMMGWHWINSRFNYVYPHDMANIALGSLCAVAAFETRRAAPAFLTGLVIAYTILLQKIGLMLTPFVLFLFVEHYVSSGRGSRKGVCITAVIIVAAALLTCLPAIIGSRNENINQNIIQAMAAQEQRQGLMVEITDLALKIGSMVVDSFYQLQVQMFDISRHVWRPGEPILDPLSSVLFSVGMVFAMLYALRKRECRLQLAGLLIFILPMALSYPLNSEGPHGLARRMIGASFFVAWIASYGAEVLASRLVSSTNVARVSVMLGSVIIAINLFHLGTSHWDLKKSIWNNGDEGGARAAMIKASREFARTGYKTVVLNEHNTTINGMNVDLPNLHIALNLQELRHMITSPHNTWLVVIIPSGMNSGAAPDNVQQLADIIPANEWIFGPVDITGIPMLRYAPRPPT